MYTANQLISGSNDRTDSFGLIPTLLKISTTFPVLIFKNVRMSPKTSERSFRTHGTFTCAERICISIKQRAGQRGLTWNASTNDGYVLLQLRRSFTQFKVSVVDNTPPLQVCPNGMNQIRVSKPDYEMKVAENFWSPFGLTSTSFKIGTSFHNQVDWINY